MNLLVEFDDSEVAAVELVGGDLRIRFSAAAALQSDESQATPSRGFARNVELRVHAATTSGLQPAHLGRIARGRVSLAGRWLTRIPVPYLGTEPVTLELDFANRETLQASGAGLECRFAGGPNFAETLFC